MLLCGNVDQLAMFLRLVCNGKFALSIPVQAFAVMFIFRKANSHLKSYLNKNCSIFLSFSSFFISCVHFGELFLLSIFGRMTIFGYLIEVVEGPFINKISVPINMEGYKETQY